MSLANKLLNNPGLIALTVEDERNELRFAQFVGSPYVVRPHKIKFGHFQDDFQGGRIPYWHVVDKTHKSYQSTLSWEGLKQWGVL
jgi:hypothetical protein